MQRIKPVIILTNKLQINLKINQIDYQSRLVYLMNRIIDRI